MESSYTPLTRTEIYEGCRTSSELSEIWASSPEPSLSPSSTAREIYEGLRTPEYWWELTPSRVDTVGEVDDGDSNGDDIGDYPIIPSAANPRTSLIWGHEHLAPRRSRFPQSGAVTHILSDNGVHRKGEVDLTRPLRSNTTLARTILLADRVAEVADDVFRFHFKAECVELKAKTNKLATLLRQAARAGSEPLEHTLRRIIDETERALEKALTLVFKCRANSIMKRVFTIIPAAAFKKVTAQLENSIGNVTWVVAISANPRVEEVGLPPIAYNDPILCMIWELIVNLYTGSMETKAYAAASLVSLADNDRYNKLIVEEGGLVPLLRLVEVGRQDCQEDAARAIGLLARDPESVEQMIFAGVCTVFTKIIRQGSMKLQSVVAWAISELVFSLPRCQDLFAQNNTIRLLVSLLVIETYQEHSKGKIYEDPATKAEMKAMVARALWKLCKGNSGICRSITEVRALLCFAMLLEKGPEEAQYNSAMALMEIASMAEQDADLRRSAFKPNSPAAKAVVDQLLRIVEKADSSLLVPCIKAIGSLARTFRATETRMIGPLVRLLDVRDGDVMREAVIALTKFACTDNYLCIDHSKAILNAGGAKHMVLLVYFGDQMVQTVSLVLLCYTALHVPDSEALAQAEVLTVLEWASKQGYMAQDPHVETLLPEAKGRLEQYLSRVHD